MRIFKLLVLSVLLTISTAVLSVDSLLLPDECAKEGALLEFIAQTDMKEWSNKAVDLRWGIAVSISDITKVVKNGLSYNQPVLNVQENDQYIVAKDIKSFEHKRLLLKPGVYDWLILLDFDNSGSWDAYLGTVEEQVKLNQKEFKANYIYSIVVDKDVNTKLKMRLNKSTHRDSPTRCMRSSL